MFIDPCLNAREEDTVMPLSNNAIRSSTVAFSAKVQYYSLAYRMYLAHTVF